MPVSQRGRLSDRGMPYSMNGGPDFEVDEVCGIITPHLDGIRIGMLKFVPHGGGSVFLGDVKIYKEVMVEHGLFAELIRRFRPSYGMIYLRRQKTGSRLVEQLLSLCAVNGITEVFGNVTPGDLKKSPFLGEWYEGLGFKISPPDGRCEGGPIAYKAIWRPL